METYSKKIADLGDEDSQPEFFSSQRPSAREDTETETFTPGSKVVQWPRLIDTIALCYLGALLMRLPVSVADFHRYAICGCMYYQTPSNRHFRMAMRNEIPYYRVLLQIPNDMKDKLPPAYLALLDTQVWCAHRFAGLN